ncbi:MAG: hypothetical protein BGO39_10485 [Chloroflexi bacterium 54-19]|nr:MAG: hypothetical protein BGO39_10485 [Chloroflexi bacterium 54-19]
MPCWLWVDKFTFAILLFIEFKVVLIGNVWQLTSLSRFRLYFASLLTITFSSGFLQKTIFDTRLYPGLTGFQVDFNKASLYR